MQGTMWRALKVMPLKGDFAKQVRNATDSLFMPAPRLEDLFSQQRDFRENGHWRLSLKFVYTFQLWCCYYYY
jgi:hypothetical protein